MNGPRIVVIGRGSASAEGQGSVAGAAYTVAYAGSWAEAVQRLSPAASGTAAPQVAAATGGPLVSLPPRAESPPGRDEAPEFGVLASIPIPHSPEPRALLSALAAAVEELEQAASPQEVATTLVHVAHRLSRGASVALFLRPVGQPWQLAAQAGFPGFASGSGAALAETLGALVEGHLALLSLPQPGDSVSPVSAELPQALSLPLLVLPLLLSGESRGLLCCARLALQGTFDWAEFQTLHLLCRLVVPYYDRYALSVASRGLLEERRGWWRDLEMGRRLFRLKAESLGVAEALIEIGRILSEELPCPVCRLSLWADALREGNAPPLPESSPQALPMDPITAELRRGKTVITSRWQALAGGHGERWEATVGAADFRLERCYYAPLWFGDQIIGALSLGASGMGFAAERTARLEQAARLAGLVLGSVLVLERERRERGLVQTLERLARLSASKLGPPRLLRAMLRGVAEALGAEAAAVYLLEAQRLELAATYGRYTRGGPGQPDPVMASPVLATVLREKTCQVVSHPDQEERPASERRGQRRSFTSVLAPLLGQQGILGLLVVRRSAPRSYDAAHLPLAQALADHLALAVQQARFWASAREQHRRAEALLQEATQAAEQERQRLSLEIHDSVAQWLAAALQQTQAAAAWVQQGSAEQGAASLETVRQLLSRSFEELRRTMAHLHPLVLSQHGLSEALGVALQQFQKETGIATQYRVRGTPRPLSPSAEANLYRVVQEALHNVRKHARASAVRVALSYTNEAIQAEVADNGVGFNPEALASQMAASDRLGLQGMRERALGIQGRLTIRSRLGRGTRVMITVPLPPAHGESQRR